MNIEFKNAKLDKIKADFEINFVQEKNLKPFSAYKNFFKLANYKGEGVCFDMNLKKVFVELKSLEHEDIRLAFFNAIKAICKLNIKSVKAPCIISGCTGQSFASMAEGILFANYDFDKYKSEKTPSSLVNVFIANDEINKKEVDLNKGKIGIERGVILANATNFVKDIVNEVPEIYTPLKMAEDAKNLAKTHKNITCKVYDEKFLEKEKMNAFLAVNKASIHPPRLIHLSYKHTKAKQRVVFVGKGLTYDSGGLSLKPSDYMLTMKADKSGAAAAMGIIKAVCELNLELEVHAILGVTENMIAGNAYKPDDVLISREGVSIEVRNTDAEGRLVLADCLSYAQDLKPDLLIDMATLTGACVVGLGEYTSGILGNNEELQNAFYQSSKRSGEFTTILHFNPYLKELIKSKIADVSNTASSRYGGAITAGLFLDKFIRKEYKDKWLHLDIAGPAYTEKAWGYTSFGAGGAGVRMCVAFLMSLLRAKK
ncbi:MULTISPECIES: leucyl aminopeptidase [unclassified Campylobacter]|uniref:leucyl aminopeptidase n=1 Tax=unclassified Campylobacter TaxID=2593542 RepID=UPI0012380659|nr:MULTISPECIES: leucyl aminopeptidase [unclassified Campylobacter]KAA6228421.1 leucyl aminopeptidase [Campylobacter sp. LR185c]KAA6228907.1 leucyl aminopeptidase [Campylobacter sp. LR196d]KAA6229394.1 leucyl aminopeptidase [Campylobacter sp. LR286c]KAA6229860.1 leucyl aminopeptidase [Campylobacter sp. LR264d]KAA6234072.1 leucyl aminopeptidase [Campylobacter sp. LR291e]